MVTKRIPNLCENFTEPANPLWNKFHFRFVQYTHPCGHIFTVKLVQSILCSGLALTRIYTNTAVTCLQDILMCYCWGLDRTQAKEWERWWKFCLDMFAARPHETREGTATLYALPLQRTCLVNSHSYIWHTFSQRKVLLYMDEHSFSTRAIILGNPTSA